MVNLNSVPTLCTIYSMTITSPIPADITLVNEIAMWPMRYDYTSLLTTPDPVIGLAAISPDLNNPAMLLLTNVYELADPKIPNWITTATVDTVWSSLTIRVFSCARSLFDIVYADFGKINLEVFVCANHPAVVLDPNPVILNNSALITFN